MSSQDAKFVSWSKASLHVCGVWMRAGKCRKVTVENRVYRKLTRNLKKKKKKQIPQRKIRLLNTQSVYLKLKRVLIIKYSSYLSFNIMLIYMQK